MRHRTMVVLLVSALTPMVGRAQQRAAQLHWMQGCWERRSGTRLIEEAWLPPRGGMLLGVSRTTSGDSLVTFEQMRIRQQGDTLVYHAIPAGQAPAEFRSTGEVSKSVTFENPTHDFPQRVMYRPAGPDSLIARIEGVRNGQLRGIDYPYRRVVCAAGARQPEPHP